MNTRIGQELEMLKGCWPELEYREEGHWVRIPRYLVPGDIWKVTEIEVSFQIPENLPGQAPYAFYVRPDMVLRDGRGPKDYTNPANAQPFGEGWGKFSWQLEPWLPTADPARGSNMVNFVQSFANRLREGH
jgi:hypothetical protein